ADGRRRARRRRQRWRRSMPERGKRRDARRQDERPKPEAGDEAADVGRIVDRATGGEAEREVDQDEHPDLADQRATLPIDRVVDPTGREQDPEEPEDRAGGTDRRGVATEHEAGHRSAGGGGEVEGEEPDASVP